MTKIYKRYNYFIIMVRNEKSGCDPKRPKIL